MTSYSRGGISVEDPCLFTFNGRWYYFVATISNPDTTIGAEALDNKHLEIFEYVNEINSLCLYGSVIYHDFDGSISKYFNRMDNHMQIVCKQMERVADGQMEMFVDYGTAGSYFAHTFLVQNIKILERDKQCITYQISLISTIWHALCANLTYSNHLDKSTYYFLLGKDAALKEQEKINTNEKYSKNGFTILKNVLIEALKPISPDVTVNVDSFDACAAKSKSEISLFSNGNDNAFTLIRFVLDRLYWNNEQIEDSLKFIAFNPNGDSYKCIDYSSIDSWNPCSKPLKFMSMFETQYEEALFSENVKLGSIAGINQTDIYDDLFSHVIWKYDSDTCMFSKNNTTLSSNTLLALYNSKPNALKTSIGDKDNVLDKYPVKELNPYWFRGQTYCKRIAEWNRDCSIYQSLIGSITKRDALIINAEGDFTHQPGTSIGNILDRTMDKIPEMTSDQLKELWKKHKQIEGLFLVLKVQHRFRPATSDKLKASYMENVVLGRNFILSPK